jgi:hypothetical protein
MAFLSSACEPLFMQITLEVPDELVAQAQARGLTPES